jgi:hypothetical protein
MKAYSCHNFGDNNSSGYNKTLGARAGKIPENSALGQVSRKKTLKNYAWKYVRPKLPKGFISLRVSFLAI